MYKWKYLSYTTYVMPVAVVFLLLFLFCFLSRRPFLNFSFLFLWFIRRNDRLLLRHLFYMVLYRNKNSKYVWIVFSSTKSTHQEWATNNTYENKREKNEEEEEYNFSLMQFFVVHKNQISSNQSKWIKCCQSKKVLFFFLISFIFYFIFCIVLLHPVVGAYIKCIHCNWFSLTFIQDFWLVCYLYCSEE